MEAAQSGYWKFGKWKGIPLYCHWTVLLWMPWYWWVRGSLGWAVVTLLAYLALLLAHELGHAVVARARRVKVHAIRLFVLHGQCEHDEPYYERDDIFIAWGGVLAQMCVLTVAVAAKHGARLLFPDVEPFLAPILFVFIDANLVIAVINLVPVAPLDGHKAWRLLLPVWTSFVLRAQGGVRSLRRVLDFRKRRAIEVESRRATADLLDRIKKK